MTNQIDDLKQKNFKLKVKNNNLNNQLEYLNNTILQLNLKNNNLNNQIKKLNNTILQLNFSNNIINFNNLQKQYNILQANLTSLQLNYNKLLEKTNNIITLNNFDFSNIDDINQLITLPIYNSYIIPNKFYYRREIITNFLLLNEFSCFNRVDFNNIQKNFENDFLKVNYFYILFRTMLFFPEKIYITNDVTLNDLIIYEKEQLYLFFCLLFQYLYQLEGILCNNLSKINVLRLIINAIIYNFPDPFSLFEKFIENYNLDKFDKIRYFKDFCRYFLRRKLYIDSSFTLPIDLNSEKDQYKIILMQCFLDLKKKLNSSFNLKEEFKKY